MVLEHAVVVGEQPRVGRHAEDGDAVGGQRRDELVGEERLVVVDVLEDVEREHDVERAVGRDGGAHDARPVGAARSSER